MIIPISHESSKVRRLPWISFFLMGLCLLIHIVISVEIVNTTEELDKTAKELVNYYIQHPYLKIDTETRQLIFGDRANEDVDKLLGINRRNRTRQIRLFQIEEQEKLDQLAQKLKDTLDDVPYRKYGYIPAKKNLIGLVTYMFIHGGWLHLLGNLLLLYLTGPFIEDVWGRPIFTAFYIIAGILSGFMFSLYSPNFMGPLIGASGAIAGLMGAFLIRYWRTKIKFWFFFFIIHGTFKAPAWLMLPIWLALEIFSANRIDSVNAEGGGVAHWAHIWGFIFGVVVAAVMKRFKIEETYVHPKIESQVRFVDEGYKAFEEAKLKINEGKADEAYVLLLGAARKSPMNRDVVEGLWNQGKEQGKEKEAGEFFIRLIESEIRRDQMDVAFVHFMELRGKVPQVSISMTCKFMLMKYLTERKDYKEAKELTRELIEEIDLNSSPVLLQDFARTASEHSPEVAKKVTEMCLQHPGIADFQKDALRTKLKELENRIQAAPAESDRGQTENVMSSMGYESKGPESQSGPGAKVQPLADSVSQTKEELIGQVAVTPESKPAVVTEMQYKTRPEGQPAVKQESQPVVEPEGQLSAVPENQPEAESEAQSEVKSDDQAGIVPDSQSAAGPEVQPLAESVGQTQEELSGQIDVELEGQPGVDQDGKPAVESQAGPIVEPLGQPTVAAENQPAAEPEVQPLAESVGQTQEELSGQIDVELKVPPETESEVQPEVNADDQAGIVPENQPEAEPEVQLAAEPGSQSGINPESQPAAEFEVQPLAESVGQAEEELSGQGDVDPEKPDGSPSPDQSIMAINATPLNVKDGKIDLNMDQIGQQLLPLNKVKSIAVVEIAPEQQQPYLLIDLFLDDPKTNDNKIRSIRLLSTGFDATKFSPGIQDQQDALKVFVSVLLKLSGATAYPDEDSILLESPQSFFSIEAYEKSILS
jgi:membrane associated rhomboid family serine protease